MAIIKQIELENFMSFAEAVVPLTTGLNVIAGANRQGKTNVLRALRWVFLNDGPAEDLLRHGHGDTKAKCARVRVVYDDGSWVERRRSSSENLYVLHYADGREEEHSGVGQGFCAPVAEITGFFPVAAGNDTVLLGWQGTADPKLLVGQSPAVVDRQLTRMIGSNILEEAVALAHADLTAKRRDAKTYQGTVERLGAQVQALAGVVEVGAMVDYAAEVYAEAKVLEQRSGQATASARNFEHWVLAAGELEGTLEYALEPVARAAELMGAAQLLSGRAEAAAGLVLTLHELDGLVASGGRATDLAGAAAAQAVAALSGATEVEKRLQSIKGTLTQLQAAERDEATGREQLQNATTMAEGLQARIADELKRNPSCPVCGRLGSCPHCGQTTTL